MIYMVNPSEPPKRKRQKRQKSRRRNPELLIVNPYSLDEGEGKETTMAKRKKNRKRKNPISRRRRNPEEGGFDLKKTVSQILGTDVTSGDFDYSNVKCAGLVAAGGGFVLCVATAVLGKHVEVGTNTGKAIVALAAGVGGGVALHAIAETTQVDALKELAVAGAFGAMVLGGWQLMQPWVEPVCAGINQKLGLAGWLGDAGMSTYTSDWQGYSPYGSVELDPILASGFGNTTAVTDDEVRQIMAEGSGLGSTAYEPLGDIYNSQRLGSFEAESGFGGFIPEVARPDRDQQPRDVVRGKAAQMQGGGFGGYEFSGGDGASIIGTGDAVWGSPNF
jgi:hypothetical protein